MPRSPLMRPHAPPIRAPSPAPEAESAPFDLADVHAIKAWAAGTATADQQQRSCRWVCLVAGLANAVGYDRDPMAMAFLQGRRFTGVQTKRIIETNTDKLKAEIDERNPPRRSPRDVPVSAKPTEQGSPS